MALGRNDPDQAARRQVSCAGRRPHRSMPTGSVAARKLHDEQARAKDIAGQVRAREQAEADEAYRMARMDADAALAETIDPAELARIKAT